MSPPKHNASRLEQPAHSIPISSCTLSSHDLFLTGGLGTRPFRLPSGEINRILWNRIAKELAESEYVVSRRRIGIAHLETINYDRDLEERGDRMEILGSEGGIRG